jgi:hypothetical protein
MENLFVVMDDERFEQVRQLAGRHDIESDENAFCCILNENEEYIVIRKGFVDSLTIDELNVVVSHEMAHLAGIMDEELADRWALNEMNETSQEILKDMWEIRHGHEYE